MLTRNDIDVSRGRDTVFAAVGSFDDRGMDDREFERCALGLLDIPGANSAAGVLAHYRRRLAAEPPRLIMPLTCVIEGDPKDILTHRYTFAGETHDCGPNIDWEHNPGTGHWLHDMHRFSFLCVLQRSLEETGDERYAREIAALVLDWIAKTDICEAFTPNLPRYAWTYLNVGIHLEVWISALAAVLKRFPEMIQPLAWLRIVKSVHDQLAYLHIVIPEARLYKNWITIGTRCMITTLATFRDFRQGPEWTRVAVERLVETIDSQVLPDGVQDELTPHYHLMVAQNLIQPLLMEPQLPAPLRGPLSGLRGKLKPMLHYMRHTLTPDGKVLAFNDGDPDAGWEFDITINHPLARELLADEINTELRSECFPYAGVGFMRQGSRRGREELYLAFDGGPPGTNHQHEDALSFWLSAYGRSFIVDPGRHLYDDKSYSYFPYLKTTRAHSTIMIDGQGQNGLAHRDRWRNDSPGALLWQVEKNGNVTAAATYDLGYGPQDIPVAHRRLIRFFPEPGYWIIEDTITGDGEHRIESRFQFAPSELRVNGYTATTSFPDANLLLSARERDWQSITVERGQENPRGGWYSDGYGKIEPAPALVLRTVAKLPFTATTLLFPYRGQTVPAAPVTI